jgi:hypothetical protein
METRLLLSRSEGGTVARAGGDTCAPRPVRLDLGPRGPAAGYGPHRTIYLSGIDANGKVASTCTRLRESELTAR